MTIKKTIRGVRDTIPAGYFLGRPAGSAGPATLLPLSMFTTPGYVANTTVQIGQAAGGDLSGTYPNPTVKAIQGNAVKSGALGGGDDGKVLTWVNANSDWEAKTLPTTHSIPAGGTTGQALEKNSNTDYDVSWVTPSSSSGGGAASIKDDGTNLYFAMMDSNGQLVLDSHGNPIFGIEVLPASAIPSSVIPVGANPSATIGSSAVNGVATTFMRSDGAPALPATLPALSGINLTALNGSNITSGTLPDARLSNTITAAGPIGDASHVAVVTYDAKGRLTTVTSVAIAIAAGAVSGLAAVATSGSASDLGSGTLPAARLPNPSASTLGGVESIAAVSHKFLTSISTGGVPAQAQPAFSDISSVIAGSQMASLYWRMSRALTNQTFTASSTPVIACDQIDMDPNGWCDIVTHPGRVIPTVAGRYLVTVNVKVIGTTGPSLNGELARAAIAKNGTQVSINIIEAEAAAIVSPTGFISVTDIVSVNGSTDYIEGIVNADDVSPSLKGDSRTSFFTGTFIGP